MIILSARSFAFFAVLALATAGCGSGRSGTSAETRQTIEVAGSRSVDVGFRLQPEHRGMESRYAAAAASTLKQNTGWLGPIPQASMTIVDPPWRWTAIAPGDDVIVLDRIPWWSASTSMTPELAVARALSRRAWAEAMPRADLPAWFVRGLVELSARRAVVPLFEAENLSPGFAFLEARFFAGFVPRFVRIRLLAETDGEPLPAYRARPGSNPTAATPTAEETRSLAAKTVLTLETLERWVGRPVFDQLITQFVGGSHSSRTTLADFERIATEVSGQDLTWLFDEAFRSSRVFDYGVADLASEPDAAGTFATTVVARRYGDALFTGSSAAPIGRFESGRGVAVLVLFEDGQQRIDHWDGRAREKTFRYRSPARAVSAVIDPERTMLLDLRRTNNSKSLAPKTGTAVSIWSGRYMIWLEDLLLNYASLG